MVEVTIYAEGGGDSQLLDTLFHKAWRKFFKSAELTGRMPRVVRGKGRKRTFDLFKTAIENPNGRLALLLVDSEEAVQSGHTVWQHLKKRDGWEKPGEAADDQAFLMVQVMETWFVADRAMLRSYFGSSFNEKKLSEWPELESVPKHTILKALDAATADCKTGYAKGRVSFDLLSRTNPAEVEQKCPHARRLLMRLRSI